MGIALHDYDGTELETKEGERLILHLELGEWGWVERANGDRGWAPMDSLQELDTPESDEKQIVR